MVQWSFFYDEQRGAGSGAASIGMESSTSRYFGLRIFLRVWKTPSSTALQKDYGIRLPTEGLLASAAYVVSGRRAMPANGFLVRWMKSRQHKV